MSEQTDRNVKNPAKLVVPVTVLAFLASIPVLWGTLVVNLPSMYKPDDVHFYDVLRYEELPAWLIPLIAFLTYAALLYAVYKTVAVCDFMKAEVLPSEAGLNKEARIKERLGIVFGRRWFRLCAGTVAAVYVLGPFGMFDSAVISKLLPGEPKGVLLAVLGRAVLLISALAIITISYDAAYRKVSKIGYAGLRSGRDGDGFLISYALALIAPVLLVVFVIYRGIAWRKTKRGGVGFPVRLATALIIPALLPPIVICWVIPYIKPVRFLIPTLLSPGMLIAYAVIISIPLCIGAIRALRAALKRRTFCRSLLSLCDTEGFECSPIKRPILSSFWWMDGESFRITAHGKTYSCKLIGSKRRGGEHLIMEENGMCTFRHPVRLRGQTLFSFVTNRNFAYEADGLQKILIINPVPQSLWTVRGGRQEEIDNGQSVGEYKVYAGTAFLRALRLDALDSV